MNTYEYSNSLQMCGYMYGHEFVTRYNKLLMIGIHLNLIHKHYTPSNNQYLKSITNLMST